MSDMTQLKADIKRAADKELIRANRIHEPKFVDAAHRFGALYGEFKEAISEADLLLLDFAEYENNELIIKSRPDLIESIEAMRIRGIQLAAETTQFIAMCEKALGGIYQDMKLEGYFEEDKGEKNE